MELIFLFSGALLGLGLGYFIALAVFRNVKNNALSEAEIKEKFILKEIWDNTKAQLSSSEQKLSDKEKNIIELNKALSAQEQMIDTLRDQAELHENDFIKMQQHMRLDFENLASRLLEEKGSHFVKQNQEQLNMILNPLREKLLDFERKVEHFYIDENKQRATLSEQIRSLTDLNKLVTEEAHNLTKALKGESKVQGNWGEMILERILEKSGLTKGREYMVQQSLQTDDGKRFQPDVIIYLPMQRHLIIDAKVSLTAYERYVSAINEDEKQKFLKEHLISIRKHLEELSQKNYQQLLGVNSLDYVLMFIPIEPAFSLALQFEHEFFYEALEKNILPVSPSTLLATLRTVSNLWRQEQQNKNSLQIAQQGGILYDKFVLWIEELELVGQRMQSAQSAYQSVMNRLSTGKGNLIVRAERLKELGAKSSKSIPEHYLSSEEIEDRLLTD
jgi:DNA recombination protein RmuC